MLKRSSMIVINIAHRYNKIMMKIADIRQFGDQVLKQKSEPIKEINRKTNELAKLMAKTMYHAQGVGLAAVQIGVLQRLILTDISAEGRDLRALINPEIIEQYGEKTEEEGCLSVAGITVPVIRAEMIKVRAIDLASGKNIEFEAEGWLARALQHEIDHLEGKLILDRTNHQSRIEAIKSITLGPGFSKEASEK